MLSVGICGRSVRASTSHDSGCPSLQARAHRSGREVGGGQNGVVKDVAWKVDLTQDRAVSAAMVLAKF